MAGALALGLAPGVAARHLRHHRPHRAPPFPRAARIEAAARFLTSRAGTTAFAVVDSHGRISGRNERARFQCASVIKAALLIAYLRRLDERHRPLDARSRALLYPMIHVSDNHAASSVLSIVGEDGLERVARRAGMSDFRPSGGWWALDEVSAADLAWLFFRIDDLIPRQFAAYARGLLSGISANQSWGVPRVARPLYRVFFKGGWLPLNHQLVDQAARLERTGIQFSVAVMTRGSPSEAYGEHTIRGVAERLVR